jgi:integrase
MATLKAGELERRGKPVPITIVAGERSAPFTESGFRARFFKLIRGLSAAEKVGQGLTFHGLRHTAGRMLADAGCDTRDIQAVLGHRTAAMSDHYAREADTRRRSTAAITKLEQARNKTV